ncbi:MFS transporter [Novosphingobium flavum]|uniref:MFS transporter n=1 Tax=Novosphingobium aerophilum TaxID=2839843 RepID=A0A7X1F4T4_9SPHN|nr:MFS transporter [Novosphingobium aerophilum]MBC2650333.1 MFS transporter [Novosphingobium aerophilum]MBC2660294.1 MFS transporter [Novosphingobium aerophilum]
MALLTSRGERISYAAGDTGFNLVWQSIELYLFFYYVEVLRLPLPVASSIFLIGAVVDWLADPTIGIVADRLSSRLPMRAWVLIGGPAVGLALALAFTDPGLHDPGLTLYVITGHVVLRLCYSLGNIPYAALTTRMSDIRAEHVVLTGLRMQGAALGGIIAALVYALVPTGGDDGARRFLTGAIVLGLLAQPCFLVTALGVRERLRPPLDTVGASPLAQLREFGVLFRQSPALRRLTVTIIASGLSITMVTKGILFLFKQIGHADLGYRAAIVPAVMLLVSVPGWTRLGGRLGRVPTLRVAIVLQLAALALAWACAGSLPLVIVTLSLAILAGCGMSLMFWALVPEIIAELEQRRHAGCAARVFALATTARKLGQALAPPAMAASLMLASDHSILPGLVAGACCAAAAGFLYCPVERAAGSALADHDPPAGRAKD